METWRVTARHQSGVVARTQLLAAGLQPHDVRRLLRRRELVTVLPGVYLDHTGRPSWTQRAWAAVLYAGRGAALSGFSALRANEGGPDREADTSPIEVGVDHARQVRPASGLMVRRHRSWSAQVLLNTSPPRQRYEDAALQVAIRAEGEMARLGVLTRAIQSRRTTAARLAQRLELLERVSDRAWFVAVLGDLESGACSVLEHGYLERVERPHGLARARRQVREVLPSGIVYRDVEYPNGQVVELDGRLFHDTATRRTADLTRDLESAAVRSRHTVRIGWGQVFDDACRTARWVAMLAGQTPRKCSSICAVG